MRPAWHRVDGGRSRRTGTKRPGPYPYWFYLPAAIIYAIFFLVPTFASFYFSFTRWDLFTSTCIGLDNFRSFFKEPALVIGLRNTLIYARDHLRAQGRARHAAGVLLTSQIIARGYLRSVIFFPVLVSTIGVGITFTVLMNPDHGLINNALAVVGIDGPGWLTNPSLALFSVALVDVWKGVGLATVIYIAGIVSIPQEYYEAAEVDGASRWEIFRHIILPLARPATATVIMLSLIGGLRSFDLIWAMTKGGPGFASDVIASVIYKQYQAGFYGLSTAGNVVLFLVVTDHRVPLTWLAQPRRGDVDEEHSRRGHRSWSPSSCRRSSSWCRSPSSSSSRQDVTAGEPAAVLLAPALRTAGQPGSGRLGPRLRDDHRLHQQHHPDRRQRCRSWSSSARWSPTSAAPSQLAQPVGQHPGAGRTDRPARGRADNLGAAEAGPVQDHARPDPDRDRLRAAFCILLFRAFIATVPRGAGRGGHRRRGWPGPAVLPGHLPAAAVGHHDGDHRAVGGHLQRLPEPALLPARHENATVQLTLFNFQSQFTTQYNLLFANILLITIPPLIMFIFFNRQIVAGMAAGAVKG